VTARRLVWLRRTSQVVLLVFFIFLLIETRLPQDIYENYSLSFSTDQDLRLKLPVGFFFQLDPLVGISSLLAGHRLIEGFGWAVAVLGLTILLGRVFCGFICPLGTVHHVIGAFKPALRGSRRQAANEKKAGHQIKYAVLICVLLAAVLGLNLAGLMDPMALLFRSGALAVVPAIGVGLRSVFEALAASDIKLLNMLSYGAEILVAPVFGYTSPAYQTAWFMGVIFLLLLFLNRIRPRFWCRYLCPLGALLAVFSRFAVLRLEQNPARCTQCNRCTDRCQGAASPRADEPWDRAACLMCFNCFDVCTEDALQFRFGWQPSKTRGPDMGRRAVLTGLLAGVCLPFFGRLDGRTGGVLDPRLIRPPGAVAEKEFLQLCQRCGQCMKVCPTNAINPTLGQAGAAGLWTPCLVMTQGYCEYTCTLCGSVCPTGAIQAITAREKISRPVRIGSAYIDRGRCLPWSGNAPCIVCQEHCPTSPKAIYLRKEVMLLAEGKKMEVQLPLVDLKRCVGCGICENKCPVRGLPAIRTIAAGESRALESQLLL